MHSGFCAVLEYFNSRPHGGRPAREFHSFACMVFQLTPSRRATGKGISLICLYGISTHALTEGDFQYAHQRWGKKFQLTPSRRATFLTSFHGGSPEYFNSRPHGGRPLPHRGHSHALIFQLTPSRRATAICRALYFFNSFQLTPSRRATTEDELDLLKQFISTHALTEGDAFSAVREGHVLRHFNSRPHGGRQLLIGAESPRSPISTHALTEGDQNPRHLITHLDISTHALTEGDASASQGVYVTGFQLTPSRRATRRASDNKVALAAFQLTPSRRATIVSPSRAEAATGISTHALTEGDVARKHTNKEIDHFNSRPHGGRLHSAASQREDIHFNSRPHGGRRRSGVGTSPAAVYFNSRPHGGRHFGFCAVNSFLNISTHALTEGDPSSG